MAGDDVVKRRRDPGVMFEVAVVVEVLAKHARGTARPVINDILIAAVAMAVCVSGWL